MNFLDSPVLPNLLYLSLVAGVWLAALAIVTPGTGVLEISAFFALVLAGLGTAYVPLNAWALAILVLGGAFYGVSVFSRRRVGLWLALAALAFSIGSVFLFSLPGGAPAVHPALASVVSILTLAYFWLMVRKALMAHGARPVQDPSAVLDAVGEVRTILDPVGSVYVDGELWSAQSDIPISPGAKVRVKGMEGLMLSVEPLEGPETLENESNREQA